MNGKARTAIVTGGSGGIGAELCARLAADGYRVAVHYGSSEQDANKVVDSIRQKGGEAIALSANIADESAVIGLFDAVTDAFGGIDVVVANAGVGGGAPIAELEMSDFDRVISINLRGALLTLREAARRMRDNGRIVFISSMIAHKPLAGSGVYAATKAGMDALVVSLSKELGERGITVNSVRPGATVPGMFERSNDERKERFRQMSPFNRLGHPSDIAALVSFLASEEAGWVTGQAIRADGGASN